jgi:hypothetical protein
VSGDAQLLSLQRRFSAALREPLFGSSRARSDLPPREGDVSSTFVDTANALMKPTAQLQPRDRLELYHRQYWYRLLESLEEDFPALKAFLGDDTFGRLIEAYIEATPPSSFTLRHYGQGLPAFLESHPQLAPHPVHASELATLEYALCWAFEAGERPAVPSERLSSAALALQPHLQLFTFRTDAFAVWSAASDHKPLPRRRPPLAARRHYAAVFRHQFRVRAERLSKAAWTILRTIEAKGSLEAAMSEVARQRLLRSTEVDEVSRWFAAWVQRGWLTEVPPSLEESVAP